ncbi:phosphoribosyltransferase family protein [Rhodococcus sp. H36-A4]|uniref:phosphoribosyltransferase n=1 Tax=Rhodococcus sp. H36-A4 TaxID=3004353 RepID=UPI0022AFDA88|nr:phosphoribosyltransferase family protein [Rhodococcus sp. H36-A4]MCZ4079097.1 phosphoribosyltransferase family protein [Rhodococcus sp. H36-A4]
MGTRTFRDRADAGQALSVLLDAEEFSEDVLVLALPRGGVPVAAEVATSLHAQLDVLVVRKLGVPRQPELAMGAIAGGGAMVVNEDVIRAEKVNSVELQQVITEEQRELQRREQLYRGNAPPARIHGRSVIVVDDGVATGATMRVALEVVHRYDPTHVVAAVPVAPASSRVELQELVDALVCVSTPRRFLGVGASYARFEQTTDEEVRSTLAEAAARHRRDQ